MNESTDRYCLLRFNNSTDFELLIETDTNGAEQNLNELKENHDYNKRYDRWYNFNLNYSARKINEPDLIDVTFESIEKDFSLSLQDSKSKR